MPVDKSVIVWFRLDLRLADNPALRAAVDTGQPVVPVFIWSPEEEQDWQPGAASRWWLHQSLQSLSESLNKVGSKLLIREGGSLEQLQVLCEELKAGSVFWNRRYEPAIIERDSQIKESLISSGIEAKSFNSALLLEPWEVKNKQGGPYKVYTPFSKFCFNSTFRPPLPAVRSLKSLKKYPRSSALDELELEPKIDWASGFESAWSPGERGAQNNLKRFLKNAAEQYDNQRNIPGITGTSRISPHLHFGEIGPLQVWSALNERFSKKIPDGAHTYLKEILWREFAYHLIFHFPHTPDSPLREDFANFPWKKNKRHLAAWQKGRTGFPIVDAGMRELWHTGWMHNRVRMIVASFLVKHLLIPWQEGAKWFWDTLVDADLASNTLGWQWTAGCGADAAPYFRVFNPILQGEKFDSKGEYVRKWIPEISALPNKLIHKPWEASAEVLAHAEIKLGKSYPKPIVDHREGRENALQAYDVYVESRKRVPSK